MSTSTSKSPRVAVLADSDTRWKWGALTAHRLAPDGRLDGYLLRGRATPTDRQLREVGVPAASRTEVTTAEFLAAMARAPHDVVVLALVGGGVQAVLHGLARAWRGRDRRPVVVTGYVGVVYEKLTDGLLLRHGADLVLANSRADAERFRAVYAGVGADPAAVVEVALPFLDGAPYRRRDPYTVVFAAQPSVPADRADRGYLLERLIRHARLHPDRRVLLKLRSRPGEHTTHVEESPYQKLVRGRATPDNLRLVYGHMGEVLDDADLLVTVSSTAALEALHRGVPTAVLTDLGVREALGNHHFVGSGCLTSWDRIDAGGAPVPDAGWVARQGVPPATGPDPYQGARDRLAALLDGPGPGPLSPYYTARSAPGYLPGLLARHHLGPDGAPLDGAPRGDRAAGPVRQAVRRAARSAYRHGVQRVAPAVRRLGEL
ncbi:DUF6716 putative glycosyltransferase [Streptomyces sp. LE64]|uniref:DUF6716 putative glycosyltransferase n=1 Tax=Streptomyces sp. LE64 TaxID=3448653 RepID=UPI0040437A10